MKRSTFLLMSSLLLAPAAWADEPSRLLPLPSLDQDFYNRGAPDVAKVELGRMLFFDKILSGNRNIACASCHHPQLASADSLALPLGEGPSGLGPKRKAGREGGSVVFERVPRNSPALFNLGALEFRAMFHDGRVERDEEGHYAGGFVTPAKWKLPQGLDNVLAAQAMFPVASGTEMAGQKGENSIADAVSLNNVAGPGGVWEQLALRLQGNPEYVAAFVAAFPDRIRTASQIRFVDAANAIAAFESVEFRADNSPFDIFLRGGAPLSEAAARGMNLFYGEAGCSGCHSGTFQTDHEFHAIAVPQIGPGKGDGADSTYWSATGLRAFVEDFGRGRVTFRPDDNYRFRTPSLRNVEITGPWGHDGAFDRLEDIVRHHLDPVESLRSYRPAAGLLPALPAVMELTAEGSTLSHTALTETRLKGFAARDTWVLQQEKLMGKIEAANELTPLPLTDLQVRDLLAFLESLTDPSSRVASKDSVPKRVPSGLPVTD